MTWRIPLADIDIGIEEAEAVRDVISSRWLTMGQVTQKFELAFADFVQSSHAIAVTNATAALHLACLALGLGPGDEVIVPSLTFVATANAVRYVGATPIFADISSLQDFNISTESIRALITPKTRAIIVVHYAGYPCDMPEILAIAKEHGLAVIEDAAHAVGAELHGQKLGTWGDIGCFSFFSNKNMTTGEGGMMTTNSSALAEKLGRLRSHGMTSLTWERHKGHAWSYDVIDLGYNYRIDELRAAIGLIQLEKVGLNNERRRFLVNLYQDAMLELAPKLNVPFQEHPGVTAAHIMPILLPEDVDRLEFMDFLKKNGIQTSIHYPPIHTFSSYSGSENWQLPITEKVASLEVTLPLYPTMSDENVLEVVTAISQAII